MSQSMNEAKALEMRRKLEQQLGAGLAHAHVGEASLAGLARAAAELGFASFVGTVAFVGRTASDQSVQFNTADHGYSSSWPAWAFEQAKLALTTGKKLWLISNGDPFGMNLANVIVLAS